MKPCPEDPYGIAKYSIEQDLVAAKKIFNLDYVIFRPHNVYGSRQNIWDRYRNVIGIFMYQLINNEPMTIFGDGTQIRAFSHIDDIVPALVKGITEDCLSGQIINVGGDESITINELASLISIVMQKEFRIVYLPSRYEVKNAFSQHKKLQKLLGIYPKVKLEEGLREMAIWVNENYSKRFYNDFFKIEQFKNIPSKWFKK
jgi:UDP-glucose 4-epimerase